jgi:hypothetical protein
MDEKEIADKLSESLTAHATAEEKIKNAEPLGDLNIPVVDVIDLLASLQHNLKDRDFSLALLIMSLMYGIESEEEFLSRLAKATLTTVPKK